MFQTGALCPSQMRVEGLPDGVVPGSGIGAAQGWAVKCDLPWGL
jgi:hypothetical protein